MEAFRDYLNQLQSFAEKKSVLLEIIEDFVRNYAKIRQILKDKKLPTYVNGYFISVLITLCAEYGVEKSEVIEQLLQLLYDECEEFWDFWGLALNETELDWKSIERFSRLKLNNVYSEHHIVDYILKHCYQRNISFPDPINSNLKVRFVDFPNEAMNNSTRNLHLPVLSTTLLPEKPQLLKLFLYYGAKIPCNDPIVAKHINNRIGNIINICSHKKLVKKCQWIEVLMSDVSCGTLLSRTLIELHIRLSDHLIKSEPKLNYSYLPSLQHQCRFVIRKQLRYSCKLPVGEEDLQIPKLLIHFLNIKFS